MNDLRHVPTFRFRGLAALGLSAAMAATLAGCKDKAAGPDPALANNAAYDQSAYNNGQAPYTDGGTQQAYYSGQSTAAAPARPTRVLSQSESYTPQQQGSDYGYQQQPGAYDQNGAYEQNGAYDPNYAQADNADGYATDIYADQAPPPLPVYDQPAAPGPDYIWTPGYWDYAQTGYYWVPGAWVAPPYQGALWTPGYWGYYGHRYRWHRGFWGLHIGYYGGVDYGFGYIGTGYYGGYWNGPHFYYNRACNQVPRNFGYAYERPVIVNNIRYDMHPRNRMDWNGPGGVNIRPRPFEVAAMREQHVAPMRTQVELRDRSMQDRGNFYAENHGRPQQTVWRQPVAATPGFARPAERGGDVNHGGFGNNGGYGINNGRGPNMAPGVPRGGANGQQPGFVPPGQERNGDRRGFAGDNRGNMNPNDANRAAQMQAMQQQQQREQVQREQNQRNGQFPNGQQRPGVDTNRGGFNRGGIQPNDAARQQQMQQMQQQRNQQAEQQRGQQRGEQQAQQQQARQQQMQQMQQQRNQQMEQQRGQQQAQQQQARQQQMQAMQQQRNQQMEQQRGQQQAQQQQARQQQMQAMQQARQQQAPPQARPQPQAAPPQQPRPQPQAAPQGGGQPHGGGEHGHGR